MLSHLERVDAKLQNEIASKISDITDIFSIKGEDLLSYQIFLDLNQIREWNSKVRKEKLEKYQYEMEYKKIKYVSREHPLFPEKLKQIPDAPVGLFYKGSLPTEELKSVAIIGSRQCTGYGRDVAVYLGEVLSLHDIQVISGMARGIDGYAGSGALHIDRRSFSVLANGVDICYPKEHIGLYNELSIFGGIISEKPPGYVSRKENFPERNRIITGLSDALIVVEAALHSGSMTTVNAALDQGKEIFCVPGHINDYQSIGCNELIKTGANILTSPDDIFRHFHMDIKKKNSFEFKRKKTREEMMVERLIGFDPVFVEDLLKKTNLPADLLVNALDSLVKSGNITQNENSYSKKPE